MKEKSKDVLELAPEIVNSMSGERHQEMYQQNTDWIEDRVYSKIKFRERYFEPPAGPFS